ncbi:unnamed protein product, partial [Mycena citricolor]
RSGLEVALTGATWCDVYEWTVKSKKLMCTGFRLECCLHWQKPFLLLHFSHTLDDLSIENA